MANEYLVRETELVKIITVYSVEAHSEQEAINFLIESGMPDVVDSDQDIVRCRYRTVDVTDLPDSEVKQAVHTLVRGV